MRLKIFCCPECARGKKFATMAALNIHLGKQHMVDYKIFLKNNKPFIKRKMARAVGAYIDEVTPMS
jgi:hypothetical protein